MQNGCESVADMATAPLITVVVPVYRAEKHLRRCVDSVLAQTYPNLQIVLVDDGSPDQCGAICEQYAAKDPRILVIHQKNGGQSSARNTGLSTVSGDYIGFVDSDDSIDADMVSYLYRALSRTQSQIAICGFVKHSEDGTVLSENSYDAETVYDGDSLLNVFLSDDKIGSHACNKLFARELFTGVLFPRGRVYEDIAIMHEVFAKAKRIVCLPENKYHYFIHGDSTSFTVNAGWAFGLYRAFADRYEFIGAVKGNRTVDARVEQMCLSKACGFAISGFRIWKAAEDQKFMDDAIGFLKNYYGRILCNRQITAKRKIKVTMLIFCRNLYFKWIKRG